MSVLPLPLSLILPRAQREAVARLTSRMAGKRHGMSKHAATATELLLGDSDRVELPYLAAVCAATAVRGWSAGARTPRGTDPAQLTLALAAIERQLARPLAHPRYA